MRACRYCSHQNADHLGYCSQCGRRMAPVTGPITGSSTGPFQIQSASSTPPGARTGAHTGARTGAMTGATTGTMAALTFSGAMSRTMLAPLPAGATGSAGASHGAKAAHGRDSSDSSGGTDERRGATPSPSAASRLGWLAGSIGYIYVYLREKLDAGDRRRRLIEERDGAERLLGGAIKELGQTILTQGLQHPDLTGLLEAIGRAEARREAAAADIVASEKLQAAEEARLGAQEIALEADWTACDQVSRDAEEVTRGLSRETQETASRLARARDARTRLQRDAEAAEATPDGKQKAAHLRHEAAGKRSEEVGLETQVARLDGQLVELRERSATVRAEAQAARAKLEAAVATRRSAGSAMKASIAGHSRERADAERQVADLTDQLGRAATQARSPAPRLVSVYQSIDRLEETLSDRGQRIAALDAAMAHYDQKKLITGVGLLTSLVALTAAVLWVVLTKK